MKRERVMKLYREIAENNPDDIYEPFRELLEILGFDAMFSIADNYGGCHFYVPSLRKLFKTALDREIRKEFNGNNYQKLAHKYGMCERSIRKIVNCSDADC